MDTYGNCRDRGINRRSLADLDLVHRLLKDRALCIGAWNHVHLDDRLRIFSTLVRRLDGNAELFTGVQFPHGLDHAGFRIDLKFVQPVVRHVIDAVRYISVFPFVVVRRFDLDLSRIINRYTILLDLNAKRMATSITICAAQSFRGERILFADW